MPLNKLENFIKNTEGRILYVNPNDLDATDSISNQGNSLAQPFKTVQRALLESARFSYLRGNNNDITEKTTILLFPGEHVIDNRPGYAIKNVAGTAIAVSPSGEQVSAVNDLSLTIESNFDITDPENILYKFNSIHGGVAVPRGTSIVSLDLRKTKVRAKYVPNPTDDDVPKTAIFRITGACYFWQLSFFDADENDLIYTDNQSFSFSNRSKPTFSHHKLTCFEYADGTNIPEGYDITDLDMYYSKLSNAFNRASGRNIEQKYPENELGFSKQRPEWEIVGAFGTDPLQISSVVSGDGFTPSNIISVTTEVPHNLTAGTPIKINGVNVDDYNISTKVQNVNSLYEFTFLLPFVRNNLLATPDVSGASVTIETDTVSGASPYVFNCSLRSVWGMNGMHADGSKASGFKSMVVAQFTGVSLQKDDRAFVKYNKSSRNYESISIVKETGAELSSNSSSTNPATSYHLNPDAIYRNGWEVSHITISNDAFVQVVSVFAIGFTRHFDCRTGGDVSITNSNSNFGQLSLSSDGFRKEAFTKDDRAFVTSIIAPRAIDKEEVFIDWQAFDVGLTTSVGISSHLYLFGFTDKNDLPPVVIQGYRVGARANDLIYVEANGATYNASIKMIDNIIGPGSNIAYGTNANEKLYTVTSGPSNSILTIGEHKLQTGEKVLIISDDGDIPENLTENKIYYAIRHSSTQIRLAASRTNAENGSFIVIYGGSKLKIISRVSDKNSGDVGSPIQYDESRLNWFLHVNSGNAIYNAFNTLGEAVLTDRSEVSQIKRSDDVRGLDEKVYKLRVVIPKESFNAKNPQEGFVIQESTDTAPRNAADFTLSTIDATDYQFKRNLKLISNCSILSQTITVVSELPHNLSIGDRIIIKNVKSTNNTSGNDNIGYNGEFTVSSILNDKTFTHSVIDIFGVTHNPGTFINNTTSERGPLSPRFERNDLKRNFYIYRSDVISNYIYNVQDGIYHLYVLNSDNSVPEEFTDAKFSQPVIDFYPELDKDNVNDNPQATKCFAKRSPIGDVVTNETKKSITRETIDKFAKSFGFGLNIIGVSTSYTSQTAGTATLTFDRDHNLSGIVTYSSINRGSGYTPGTYHNVKLYNNGTLTWDGATARVVVSGVGNSVTAVDIMTGGSGYTSGEVLNFDTSTIGPGSGASLSISATGISTAVGNVIQTTGLTTTTDGYFRITSVPSRTQVAVAITNGDPRIETGQYLFNIGKSISITSVTTSPSDSDLSIVTCPEPHGLVNGNKFRVISSSNNNLGDYLVKEVVSTTSFTTYANNAISSARTILKHGLSSNEAISDLTQENIASRGVAVYDNETLSLVTAVTTQSNLRVATFNSQVAITNRFPLGSFIQIQDEIMRVTSSTLSGSGNDEIAVIRGYLGTNIQNHPAGSLIRKIKPVPVEFRRPAIIRASGHTFEYLGYGPGNYSTSLPSLQVKTLTEREDFLAQSQEKSSGIVVYTGMNSDGDFFIGNTKYSSTSGKQTTFDIPITKVTGQDPSRLSVVFDEVTIKERLLVEGGNSGTILSQFNGPVVINKELKVNATTTLNGSLRVRDQIRFNSTLQSTDKDTGSVVIEGGLGVEKNTNIGGNLSVVGITTLTNTFVNGTLDILGNTIYNGSLTINGTTTAGISSLSLRRGVDLYLYTNDNLGSARLTCDADNILTIDSNVLIEDDLNVKGDITAFYTPSDANWKDNVVPIPNALNKVISISGNTFDWNEKSNQSGRDVGVIAQEIQEVLPEAVVQREDHLSVSYDKIVPLLIEALKELNEKVEQLNNQINNK